MLFSEPKIPQSTLLPSSRLSEQPFQCSSASRKFLNRGGGGAGQLDIRRFSALQRAENSSMKRELVKTAAKMRGFSALQRAENSSMPPRVFDERAPADVSVLFSEPKIPQWDVVA